jgi:hypothetical protein
MLTYHQKSFFWKIYHTNQPYEHINHYMLIAKLKDLIFIEDILYKKVSFYLSNHEGI